jgi:hypothetical protein
VDIIAFEIRASKNNPNLSLAMIKEVLIANSPSLYKPIASHPIRSSITRHRSAPSQSTILAGTATGSIQRLVNVKVPLPTQAGRWQ